METFELTLLTREDVVRIVRSELAKRDVERFSHEGLLTAIEVGQVLSVKTSTVWAWRREGKLPYIELAPGEYRFRTSDILAWIDEREGREPTIGEKPKKARHGKEKKKVPGSSDGRKKPCTKSRVDPITP